MEKRNKIGSIILLIIYILVIALFVALLLNLNVLPKKYLIPGLLFLSVFSLMIFSVFFRDKTSKGLKFFFLIVTVLIMIGSLIGSYFIGRTIVFLDRMSKEDTRETLDYYMLVNEGSDLLINEEEENLSFKDKIILSLYPIEDDGTDKAHIEDISLAKDLLNNHTIGTVISKDDNYSIAKGKIFDIVQPIYTYEENEKVLYEKLLDGTYDCILVSASTYEILNYDNKDLMDKTDILYIEKVEKKEESSTERTVDILKDSYTILLSGSDFYGAFADDTIHRSDVDMLITVNPRTHKVFLASMPRDYFVKLHSYGEYDKLTHSSLKGMNELEQTIEDTFEINIDYYVRVNFNAVIGFVDAIGGIDVDSEKEFDIPGKHITIGMNHLDGSQTLDFVRERHSFADGSTSSKSEGDLQRIRDQQIAIEAILKKATQSTTILSNYSSILESLGRRIETNISRDDISKVIKAQLETMPTWEISKYSIFSEFGWEICYLAPYYGELCVAYQDPAQNAYVRDEIIRIMNEN